LAALNEGDNNKGSPMLNRKWKLVLLGVVAMTAFTSSASACPYLKYAYHPGGANASLEVYSPCQGNHDLIQACDTQVDGHRTRAHWKNAWGTIAVGFWAPSQGCVHEWITGNWAKWVRSCIEEEGCTGWQ
jgi:hypothetical protein